MQVRPPAPVEMQERWSTTSPPLQASTASASLQWQDEDGGYDDFLVAIDCHHTYEDDYAGRPSEPRPEGAEERQRFAQVGQERPGAFGYDSSDDEGPEEDGMHDLKHSGVDVGDDEMRARVDDATRGLHRLEQMEIDPRELPTIRALFVRWTIMQWALDGPTHDKAMIAQDVQGHFGQTATGHNLMASNYGKTAHSAMRGTPDNWSARSKVSLRKRTRGDSEWDTAEDAQLGHIRGPACSIAKACRTGIPQRHPLWGEPPHQPSVCPFVVELQTWK